MDTTPTDEKYIVFKRPEWEEFLNVLRNNIGLLGTEIQEALIGIQDVDDAVVIRRQDVFAPGALHAYGDNVTVVAKLCRQQQPEQAESLEHIADYFKAQSLAAEREARKLPD